MRAYDDPRGLSRMRATPVRWSSRTGLRFYDDPRGA